MAQLILITAKRNGYRRCGMAHPDHAVEYPASRFTAAQLKILQADPGLVVQIVDEAAPQGDAKTSKTAKPAEK